MTKWKGQKMQWTPLTGWIGRYGFGPVAKWAVFYVGCTILMGLVGFATLSIILVVVSLTIRVNYFTGISIEDILPFACIFGGMNTAIYMIDNNVRPPWPMAPPATDVSDTDLE